MVVVFNLLIFIIVGFIVSIDLIFCKFYLEEKKNYKILVMVSDLLLVINWYYKFVYLID